VPVATGLNHSASRHVTESFGKPFDKPFDKLTVLSASALLGVEGLTVLSISALLGVEGLTVLSTVYCLRAYVGSLMAERLVEVCQFVYKNHGSMD